MTRSCRNTAIRALAHPFPLLYDAHSRVLILGSFPSVKAVAEGYYYANPHNRFYHVMSALLGEDLVNVDWNKKKEILLRNRIALHDVIGYCHIHGSSDALISNIRPADLQKIFNYAPIVKVICNGAKAYQEYLRFFHDVGIPVVQLPSTSPANAKMSLSALIKEWKLAFSSID